MLRSVASLEDILKAPGEHGATTVPFLFLSDGDGGNSIPQQGESLDAAAVSRPNTCFQWFVAETARLVCILGHR